MLFFKSKNQNSITVTEASVKLKASDAVLVDVREVDEYRGGHAAGAINIPLSTFASDADNIKHQLSKYSEVYVICRSGGRSVKALQY